MSDSSTQKRAKTSEQGVNLPSKLTESYLWTTAHRRIGKYGERLCDAITQAAHQAETGKLSCGILGLKPQPDGAMYIKLDLRRVMANSTDFNYGDAEMAIKALQHVLFESRFEGIWSSTALITDPKMDEERAHTLDLRVPAEIWAMFLDRAHGHRTFNPLFGYKFSESTYRLYKLVCGQEDEDTGEIRPLTFRFDELKKMLGVTSDSSKASGSNSSKVKKKDLRYADFTRYILDPARDEMINNPDCEVYFDYAGAISAEQKNLKKKGRPSFDMVTFYPKRKKAGDPSKDYACDFNNDIEFNALPKKLVDYLINTFDLTEDEIKNSHIIAPGYVCMMNNHDNFIALITDPDNQRRVFSRKTRADRIKYLMGIIRKHCKDRYGVDLGSQKEKTPIKETRLTSLDKIVK